MILASIEIAQKIAEAGADTILSWALAIVVIGSIFFEISPIKINPITALVQFIFKPINDRIDTLQKDFDTTTGEIKDIVNQIGEVQDKHRFATIRWEILSFRNSLNNGSMFTMNEYQHILDDYEEYQNLHTQYGFVNGYIEDAIKDIKDHYEENKSLNVKYF